MKLTIEDVERIAREFKDVKAGALAAQILKMQEALEEAEQWMSGEVEALTEFKDADPVYANKHFYDLKVKWLKKVQAALLPKE